MRKYIATLLLSAALCFLPSCGLTWSLTEEGVSTVKDGVIVSVDKDGNVTLTPVHPGK